MTKSDLILRVSRRTNMTRKRAEEVVNAFFESMSQALASERRIEVRGFGSFSVRAYDARAGRNPRTGERVFVDEKKSVHFKVGKELREKIAEVPPDQDDPAQDAPALLRAETDEEPRRLAAG